MEDLKKLAEELEKLLNQQQQKEETSNEKEVQKEEKVEDQPQQVLQQQPSYTEEDVKKLEAYRELGFGRFIAKNADFPNINKLISAITAKADQYMMSDLQKGVLKDDYYEYLEMAKNDVLKEITSTAKQILSYTMPKQETRQPAGIPSVDYTMKDYYNEYKKMLMKSTVKHADLEFRDGYRNEKGLVTAFGKGELEVYDKVKNL